MDAADLTTVTGWLCSLGLDLVLGALLCPDSPAGGAQRGSRPPLGAAGEEVTDHHCGQADRLPESHAKVGDEHVRLDHFPLRARNTR